MSEAHYTLPNSKRIKTGEAASILGVSTRLTQKLCQLEEIKGAAKVGSIWTIPIHSLFDYLNRPIREIQCQNIISTSETAPITRAFRSTEKKYEDRYR